MITQHYSDEVVRQWTSIESSFGEDDFLSAGVQIGMLARRREKLLKQALVTFGKRGIRSMEDYRLLALVTRLDPNPTTASEASEVLGLSKAATAMRLERFEAAGLIVRETREYDRRTIEVHISKPGRALAIECTHAVKQVYADLLYPIDPEELAQLQMLIRKAVT